MPVGDNPELFSAEPGVQDDTIVVFSFATRADLDAWFDSPLRTAALDRMEPTLAGERTINVVGGFAGWFTSQADRPAPIWKQAVLVLSALYPVALAMLSWLVMPPLTRRVRDWLSR